MEHGCELRQASSPEPNGLAEPLPGKGRASWDAKSCFHKGGLALVPTLIPSPKPAPSSPSGRLRLRSDTHTHSGTWVKSIFSSPHSLHATESLAVSAVSKADPNPSPVPCSHTYRLVQAIRIQKPPPWSPKVQPSHFLRCRSHHVGRPCFKPDTPAPTPQCRGEPQTPWRGQPWPDLLKHVLPALLSRSLHLPLLRSPGSSHQPRGSQTRVKALLSSQLGVSFQTC